MSYNADIMAEIAADAQRYRVPADYFNRLIASESSYNPRALGPPIPSLGGVRAEGIGQFIPSTAKRYGINPWDWKQALDASAKYLRQTYDEHPEKGWLYAIGVYKGVKSSSSDATKIAYAQNELFKKATNETLQNLPNVTLAGGGKLVVTDSYKLDDMWTSLGQAPIFKSMGWFQQDKIDPKTGEKVKVDAQTGEPSTGSFSNMIVNYGLVGLGAVFVITAGVRLSL